jgi:hypothetical protein
MAFTPNSGNATDDERSSQLIRLSLEPHMHEFQCFDMETSVSGNELVKHIYKIAKRMSPIEALKGEVLSRATEAMLRTSYAVFAGNSLFSLLDSPADGTGTHTVEEKRLFIIEPVAYIIIATFSITVILNIWLFFYTRQPSILKEEPYGLLSAAGILHRSAVNESMMQEIIAEDCEPRRARTTGLKLYQMDERDIHCFWHSSEQRITVTLQNMQVM